jgi:hypothetical protein
LKKRAAHNHLSSLTLVTSSVVIPFVALANGSESSR